MKKYCQVFITLRITIIFFTALTTTMAIAQQKKHTVSIIVDKDPDFPTWPRITFENNIMKAVVRGVVSDGLAMEHSIRDWFLKQNGADEVTYCIDACAMRQGITKTKYVKNTPTVKTIELTFGNNNFVNEYTIYSNKPYLKITYKKFVEANGNGWMNIVDITNPGGDNDNEDTTMVYGYENFIRPYRYYEDAYWNIDGIQNNTVKDSSNMVNDPLDGGTLNYKNHAILTVYDTTSNSGFCRIIPFWKENTRGGMRILKLLWNKGFETFPALGKAQQWRPPFTSYVFIFNKGPQAAIADAKKIIDTF
jgi:hypothetical protein